MDTSLHYLNRAARFVVALLLAACASLSAVPTSTSIPPSAIPTAGGPNITAKLSAHYAFDGDVADSSGNAQPGAVNGATLSDDRFGNANRAYRFDGVDDYLEIPDARALDLVSEATFSVWLLFEPQASGDYYTLFEKSDVERDGHARYGMWIIGDRAEACIEPNSGNPQLCVASDRALQPQMWHHIAATYDRATLRLYLDGQPTGERTNPVGGIAQNNFELFVGTDRYQPNQSFTAMTLDDLRLYKRALTPEEIQLLYDTQP